MPGLIPGPENIVMARMPPSKVVPLPSLNGLADPAWSPNSSQGPLSLVNIT